MQGKVCVKDNRPIDNDIYNLISQFEDNKLEMINYIHVLDGSHWVEMLKTIQDPEIRSKIIDQIGNTTSTSQTNDIGLDREIQKYKEPYTMNEVFRLLKSRQTESQPASLKDILLEINNLKSEIRDLKTSAKEQDIRISNLEMANVLISTVSNVSQTLNNGQGQDNTDLIQVDQPNNSENKCLVIAEESPAAKFLQTLESMISHKWYIKITLRIDNYFCKEFTALIDSGAELNVIQEGLIPTRYFEKTSHALSHAGGERLNIKFKLPKASICVDGKRIPLSFPTLPPFFPVLPLANRNAK
jgi:hypothetical protein